MIIKGPVLRGGGRITYQEGFDYLVTDKGVEFLDTGNINKDAKSYMEVTGEKYCPLEVEYTCNV